MEPVRVSFCYAREDERLRNELDRHLGALKHSGQVITWHDRKILPGANWEKEIDEHLSTSDVILLLVSPHLLDSAYFYGVELKKSLEMHEAGTAYVIPIILRPVHWKTTPLGALQALPRYGRPIVTWRDRNAALLDVIQGIRQVILLVLTQKLEKEVNNDEIIRITWQERQDLRAIGADGNVFSWKSVYLEDEKQYEVIEQMLSLDPRNLAAHHWKGGLLFRQEKYQEALSIYESILQLDPDDTHAHRKKGRCLFELGNYEKALEVLNYALQLSSDDLNAFLFKGHVSSKLGYHEEALAIFEQIRERNPENISMYHYMAQELRFLDRVTEAKQIEHIYSRQLRGQINPTLPLSTLSGEGHDQPPPANPYHDPIQSIHEPQHHPQRTPPARVQSVLRHTRNLKHTNHIKNVFVISPIKTVASLIFLASVVAVPLLVIHLNHPALASTPVITSTLMTTPTPVRASPNLMTSGKPIPGQMLQVIGNHFPSGQTVLVTLDGQPLSNNGTTAYTSFSPASSMFLASLSSTGTSGTPVTVRTDGTFTLAISIPMDWAGSIHHLTVSNQAGIELGSLDLTIESKQATPTPMPTPTPTPAPVVRLITSRPQTQSQMAYATGQGTIPGTQATGTVNVAYRNSSPLYLSAGTVLTNTDGCTNLGLQISLDNAVNLPSYTGSGDVSTTVSIHVVQVGTSGNIQDCPQIGNGFLYCNISCGIEGMELVVADLGGGFTGGTDTQHYSYIQQSDIDNAAAPLKTSTTQAADANIQWQLRSGEYLVGNPQCASNTASDHAVNDRVSTVTVTVTTTCTATAST